MPDKVKYFLSVLSVSNNRALCVVNKKEKTWGHDIVRQLSTVKTRSHLSFGILKFPYKKKWCVKNQNLLLSFTCEGELI